MRIWRKLLFLFRQGKFDRDLEEEIRLHLEMKAQAGGGTEEAHYAAQRKFGNAILLREISRWLYRLLNAGVVEGEVETTECFNGLFECGLDVVCSRYIAPNR